MSSMLWSFGTWNWFILGAILLAIEIFAPGTFLLWLGLSAIAVGVASLFIVWPWQAQLVAFAVLSVASLVLWRRFGRAGNKATDQPFLNRRAESYVGRTFTLDKPVVGGVGNVRIDDTVWRVTGPDCPAGSHVRIARAEGATLIIERLS